MSGLISKVIPTIVDFALQLPVLLYDQIPILRTEQNCTLYLTRKLCASLLANAFLCTFPTNSGTQSTTDFNLFALFNTDRKFANSVYVKREKIKCLLHYFKIIENETSAHNQIISFERRGAYKSTEWPTCNKTMCPVDVDNFGKIEDCKTMLQVMFANKTVGKGVYGENCVMEDIRFCISPELIVAKLFTETLRDNEVLVVTGSEVYSTYNGYGQTFKCLGPQTANFKQSVDRVGRTYTQVVAMDAQFFNP